MKGELYKEEEGYYVYVNTVILGTTRPLLNLDFVKYKLSLDNCEDIERETSKNNLDGWDVEIEMDFAIYPANLPKEGEERPVMKPKLDTNGCLILKTK